MEHRARIAMLAPALTPSASTASQQFGRDNDRRQSVRPNNSLASIRYAHRSSVRPDAISRWRLGVHASISGLERCRGARGPGEYARARADIRAPPWPTSAMVCGRSCTSAKGRGECHPTSVRVDELTPASAQDLRQRPPESTAMTGTPAAMASRAGRPKPSLKRWDHEYAGSHLEVQAAPLRIRHVASRSRTLTGQLVPGPARGQLRSAGGWRRHVRPATTRSGRFAA